MFCKKGVLRNFAKFTGKHLCQSLFFNKVAGLKPATLLKKRLWCRCFLVTFVKFLRKLFLTEHLRWLVFQETSRTIFYSNVFLKVIKFPLFLYQWSVLFNFKGGHTLTTMKNWWYRWPCKIRIFLRLYHTLSSIFNILLATACERFFWFQYSSS